jgi:hypothetical protein
MIIYKKSKFSKNICFDCYMVLLCEAKQSEILFSENVIILVF